MKYNHKLTNFLSLINLLSRQVILLQMLDVQSLAHFGVVLLRCFDLKRLNKANAAHLVNETSS